MELVRRFAEETYQRALEDWAWLEPVSRLGPSFANTFGDIFLKDGDGAMWFLDTLSGTVERLWPDAATLNAQLDDAEVRERYLMASLAENAREAGLAPGPTSVLSFAIPPVLGGPLTVENLEIADFEVVLAFAGQVHHQVRGMSPGQPITGVSSATANGAAPAQKRGGLFRRRSK